jgi:hypothetical protein
MIFAVKRVGPGVGKSDYQAARVDPRFQAGGAGGVIEVKGMGSIYICAVPGDRIAGIDGHGGDRGGRTGQGVAEPRRAGRVVDDSNGNTGGAQGGNRRQKNKQPKNKFPCQRHPSHSISILKTKATTDLKKMRAPGKNKNRFTFGPKKHLNAISLNTKPGIGKFQVYFLFEVQP